MATIDVDISPIITVVSKRLKLDEAQTYNQILKLIEDIEKQTTTHPLTADELNIYYDVISAIGIQLMKLTQSKYGVTGSGAAAPFSTVGYNYNINNTPTVIGTPSSIGRLLGDLELNDSLQRILPTIMLNDRTTGTLTTGLRRRITNAPNHVHQCMIDAMALMSNIGVDPRQPTYQTDTRNALFHDTKTDRDFNNPLYIPYSTIRHKSGIENIIDMYLKGGILFTDKTKRTVWNIGRLLTEYNTGCLVVSALAAYLTDVEIAYFLQGNVAVYLQQSGSAEYQFMVAVIMGCLLGKFNVTDLNKRDPDVINVVFYFTMAPTYPTYTRGSRGRNVPTPTDHICDKLSSYIGQLLIETRNKLIGVQSHPDYAVNVTYWPLAKFTVTLLLRLDGHPFGHAFELSVTYDKGNYYATMYDGYSTKYIKKSSAPGAATNSSAFSSYLIQSAQPTVDKRVYMHTIDQAELDGLSELYQMYKGVVIPAVIIPITFKSGTILPSTDPTIIERDNLQMDRGSFYNGIRGQCILQGKQNDLALWVPFIKTSVTATSRYSSIYPREILNLSTAQDINQLLRTGTVTTPRSQMGQLQI